jgi:hypothetical protein
MVVIQLIGLCRQFSCNRPDYAINSGLQQGRFRPALSIEIFRSFGGNLGVAGAETGRLPALSICE